MEKYHYEELHSSIGASETVKVLLKTNMNTGKSNIVIEKTISEEYGTNELEAVKDLAKRLMGGNGRKKYKLEDLTK